ncbi:MAG: ATP-binding protein [Nanoarchaeota archaeon]
MTHYFCTGGCNGLSENPISCQMPSCSKHQLSLSECNCTNGKHQNLFQNLNDSILLVIAGLPGTGKTIISKRIAQKLNYAHIDQNEIRRQQGIKKMPQTQDATLRKIDRIVAETLNKGKGIIVDSVHRYMFRRQQLYGVASGAGARVLVIECVCSSEEAKKRINQRPNSDGLISDPNNTKVYDKLAQLWEDIKEHDFKYPGSDHVSYITYNTENNSFEEKIVQKEMMPFVNIVKQGLSSS